VEDRSIDAPLAGLSVYSAELCVWPDAGEVEPLCAGFLARNDSGHGDVCLSWLAGQCRRGPSAAYDRRVGLVRRRPLGDCYGDGIRNASGEESIGEENRQHRD